MSEKQKIQRFNLDEGRIWEAIEGISPFRATYTLEEVCEKLNEQQDTIERLNRRLDYETRMHKKWKDDCLAILEEQDLNDYVKELKKGKKSGWDSEPNTDYITRAKEGLK